MGQLQIAQKMVETVNQDEVEIRRKTEELKKQFEVYKAKMEALLISGIRNFFHISIQCFDSTTYNIHIYELFLGRRRASRGI